MRSIPVKSLLGEGSVVVDTYQADDNTVSIYAPEIDLASADAFGAGPVAQGEGPNLALATIQGLLDVDVSSPNSSVLAIDATSFSFEASHEGAGVNLVYQGAGPEVALKSLATPADDVLVVSSNAGAVELSLRECGLLCGIDGHVASADRWYYAKFAGLSARPLATGPYGSSVLGTAVNAWTEIFEEAGLIDGTGVGTSGNDDALVSLEFAVPPDSFPYLNEDSYVMLAVLGCSGNAINNIVACEYFYTMSGGLNLMQRASDGYGVGRITVEVRPGTPQFAVGAFHYVYPNLVLGSGAGLLEGDPSNGMMDNPASSRGLPGSRLVVEKFR